MEITATEFKAKCLELLDRVGRTGEVITVTKRGKVVAELRASYGSKKRPGGFGFAKGEAQIVGDIMAPIGIDWEAETLREWDELR